MRFYAEHPGRVARQLVADVLVIGWVIVSVFLATTTYTLLNQLQAPGRALVDAGNGISSAFDAGARTASSIPLVGDDIASALTSAGGSGVSLSDAGRQQIDSVATFSTGTAIAIVALFALPVVLLWLTLRLRYAHKARTAVALRDHGTDLLALRALSRVNVLDLMTISPDPAAAWRHGDRAVIHQLAALELRSLGLHAPRAPQP